MRLLPLLVHHPAHSPHPRGGGDHWTVERILADEPDLGRIRAVADLGWRQVDTAVGPAGARERDAEPIDAPAVAFCRTELADARRSMVVVRSGADGPVALGSHRPVGDVTEIVGVAVLPAFRRQGLASRLTGALVADAYNRGVDVVMLVAESEAVARIYERIGFRRIGSAGVAEDAG